MKKEKNKKKKKLMKRWEKVFILGSLLIIIGFIALYSTRLIHYYKLEHPKVDKSDKRLITAVLRDNKTVIKDDGLYKDDKNNDIYYFKGKDITNNYVYYSGRLWRIMNIEKDTLTLITEDIQTSIVWGLDNNYDKSYVKDWLNNVFLKTLNNDYENEIVKTNFCIDEVKLDNLTCENKYESNVGLITIADYMKAGGKDSYLDNGTYFWTMNSSEDKNIWYIFDEGGINNESKTQVTYRSYGIRPVVKIKKDISVLSGEGTKDNPYYLDDNTNTIVNSKQIGNYIMYSNQKWIIQDKEDNYVKLILSDYLKEENKEVKIKYDGKYSKYDSDSTISDYLNSKFYKSLDKTGLKKCKFNIGSYGEDSKYNYKNVTKETISEYVGIPSISDMFINKLDGIWLSNNIDDIKLMAYTSKSTGTYFADSITNNNYIRPVICIDSNLAVTSGSGLENDPFMMEVKNETNN